MENNRWKGLRGEIFKLVNASLQYSFPDLDKKCLIPFVYPNDEDEYGDCKCQNVLTIWPKLRNNLESKGKYQGIEVPRDVGKKIKEKLSESDMIMDLLLYEDILARTCDVGFVTLSLSRKWIARSIHKMLKDGIDTWAPELGLKKVIVASPSLGEDIEVDLFRQHAIRCALIRMLDYSKVELAISPSYENINKRLDILNNWFSNEEREDVVIIRKPIPAAEDAYKDFKQPFRLAKDDFNKANIDLGALWHGLVMQKADWIVYVTPVRQQEYIKMCFIAAELEKWIPSGDEPSRTSYIGYRTCTTELEDNMLDEAKTLCKVVAQGAAELLGYTSEDEVLDCAFKYAFLKNHRLSLCTFDIEEMFEEEGNTFVYLLNRLAEIRKITDGSREHIDELRKASELIISENDEWGEERRLELHLLLFTDELKESCLSVLPELLCEYLYDLSRKFTSYYNNVCKVGSVKETSTLLLCEATAVVMEKCFHLLGISPECSISGVSETQLLPWRSHSSMKRPMDLKARDPPRTSRFELFSVRPYVDADKTFEEGKLFGSISVSDKYGLLSDKGSEFFEPDFAHVRLFDHDWRHPINMRNAEPVYLGNPTSRHSVPFSSSIEVVMCLFATTAEKDECFQICKDKFDIDTSDFWDEGSDSKCGWIDIPALDAATGVHYILLRDAVDTDLEVQFNRKTKSRVRAWIRASYGRGFRYKCHPVVRECYDAVLYEPNPESSLEIGPIPLKKSMLAVPVEGSLVIEALILDVESEEVILDGRHEFNSQREGNSNDVINGIETGCSLELKVNWKYRAYNLDESEAGSPSFMFQQLSKKRKHKQPMYEEQWHHQRAREHAESGGDAGSD